MIRVIVDAEHSLFTLSALQQCLGWHCDDQAWQPAIWLTDAFHLPGYLMCLYEPHYSRKRQRNCVEPLHDRRVVYGRKEIIPLTYDLSLPSGK